MDRCERALPLAEIESMVLVAPRSAAGHGLAGVSPRKMGIVRNGFVSVG